jgi:DNA-binding transcriptional ArsR family regulator
MRVSFDRGIIAARAIIHVDVNDDIIMNNRQAVWQDEPVTPSETLPTGPEPGASGLREVTDVETLRVLADPLRLAILTALMDRGGTRPRVMSVKELAEELGEPQTKLYRHVRQLEAAGLIEVAASRLVSGILEQRYQACQNDLSFGPGLLRGRPDGGDSGEMLAETQTLITTLLSRYRDQFFASHRSSRPRSGEQPPGRSYREPVLSLAETRVSPKRAAAIREKLQEVLDELNEAASGNPGDGVPVNVLIGFFSPADPPDPAASPEPAPSPEPAESPEPA